MKKSVRQYLDDLIDYINRIKGTIEGHQESDIWLDIDMQDLLLRRIEVLGEVVKRFPPEFREKYPNVSWNQITGARDKIAHDYDGLDYSQVWEIASKDIPEFEREVLKMIEDIDNKIAA